MRKKFEERGFMDLLYWMNFKFTWTFTVCCFLLNAFSGLLNITDLSVVSVGLTVVWGDFGMHTALMVWKAKAENCRKFKDVNRLEELEREVDNS